MGERLERGLLQYQNFLPRRLLGRRRRQSLVLLRAVYKLLQHLAVLRRRQAKRVEGQSKRHPTRLVRRKGRRPFERREKGRRADLVGKLARLRGARQGLGQLRRAGNASRGHVQNLRYLLFLLLVVCRRGGRGNAARDNFNADFPRAATARPRRVRPAHFKPHSVFGVLARLRKAEGFKHFDFALGEPRLYQD